ncbi:glutamine--tRNA ligase [Amphibiibacter pelophylacis]|uniref:Glutamine--tRNA ligase n=1 Tax=Amphibiibacter pelophylacis TaxID=1799477 RepID=A0ACC6NZI9_9BURK
MNTPNAAPPAPETATPTTTESPARPSNFLRQAIERDLAAGTYAQRRWGGGAGDAAFHAQGELDPAAVRLRFPPEPNGYLHIGHAKSICLNFGLARDYGGLCHMRFDDTNPEKEDDEYVRAILRDVRWLGFDWASSASRGGENLYFASDYFDLMHRAAVHLIRLGLAYVDEQSADDMRRQRGDFATPGTDSPFRGRSVDENLARFAAMKAGGLPDGAAVLRAKIDMASPNMNLRDPAIYRIRHTAHHRTGDAWCIYPMYTFAHPIEDALERISHSICTLEFEDQRPFYDWLLEQLSRPVEGQALLAAPLPRQYEFARLNLTHVVTSKRKLLQMVQQGVVSGWDDPRLPTIAGLRRRGYTAASLQLMAERTGASKANAWNDYSVLDIALRDDLDAKADRAVAILQPLELVLDNWADVFGSDSHREPCAAPLHPHHPERGQRPFTLGPRVWIELDDFAAVPSKGFFRLFPPHTDAAGQAKPGSKVRLKYGYVIECTGFEAGADGQPVRVHAHVVPDTKSGTPGADSVKVKGVVTWLGQHEAVAAEVRLFDHLFLEEQPSLDGDDWMQHVNPQSLQRVQAFVSPDLVAAPPLAHWQFERHGYFVSDERDHSAATPVFNRVTALKEAKGK